MSFTEFQVSGRQDQAGRRKHDPAEEHLSETSIHASPCVNRPSRIVKMRSAIERTSGS